MYSKDSARPVGRNKWLGCSRSQRSFWIETLRPMRSAQWPLSAQSRRYLKDREAASVAPLADQLGRPPRSAELGGERPAPDLPGCRRICAKLQPFACCAKPWSSLAFGNRRDKCSADLGPIVVAPDACFSSAHGVVWLMRPAC
jgi:hypothetical protein